ncbi:MAG: Transketolase 2 [Lentisphaerae bacterium ADurb.Bin242]|nr:MAG: Transketolase 2 [Lentisphaerae bacterium ADurb.Bin242]
MNQQQEKECRELAKKVRIHCLEMVHKGKSGHIGSMLSMADILPVLFTQLLNIDPKTPKKVDRDRFILSKGHGGAALLATMAELGFFPLEWLDTYYQDNGKLSGHISHHIPGVEFSTGSLGHGLPVACGMAMAARQAGKKHKIYCLVSDGDLNEGSSWEAIMLAGQHKWGNLVMLVDYNRLQALGASPDIIDLEPLAPKLEMFGWTAKEADGHDLNAIYDAAASPQPGKPNAVIFRTVKGKGVSFMENNYKWHYGGLTGELLEKALKEVEAAQ